MFESAIYFVLFTAVLLIGSLAFTIWQFSKSARQPAGARAATTRGGLARTARRGAQL